MPGGRPSKYKPEYCEMLIEHMKKGLSFESFSGLVGVHLDTLYEWQKKPEFSEAKNIGRAYERLFWEKIYTHAAMGYNKLSINGKEVIINPNPTLIIFKMKNAFQWRDNQDIINRNVNMTHEQLVEYMEKAKDE